MSAENTYTELAQPKARKPVPEMRVAPSLNSF
jgi:hypothetical protein